MSGEVIDHIIVLFVVGCCAWMCGSCLIFLCLVLRFIRVFVICLWLFIVVGLLFFFI